MALYNGNISETYWKSSSDNVLRKYGYSYDGLNRLNASLYMKPMTSQQRGMDLGSYNEHITYDKNGNINTLFRNGDLDSNLDVIVIDDLEYTYDSGNKLLKVIDNSNHPEGFKDGANSGNDYVYDDFGNMTQDLNKGINSITYNHLNLPKKITYSTSSQNISYLYNALGVKVQKKVFKSGIVGTFNPDHTVTTDYLSGFHYEFNDNPNIASSGGLVFFATSEGYVNVTTNRSVSYNYVYNYTDHLGNIRVSYTNGLGGVATILEENHYYPFGLKHKKYGSTVKDLVEVEDGEDYYVGIEIVPPGARKTYQYKFGGNEFQDELGLNVYDYDNRIYDQALGRFWQMDPLAEQGRRWSPYNYCFDNPIYFQDPDGMWPKIPSWNDVKQAYRETKATVAKTYNQTKASITKTYNETKASVTKTYNETKASVTKTYNEAKSTVAKTYNETKKAVVDAKDKVVASTKETVKEARQWVKENEGTITAVSKGMQDLGDGIAVVGYGLTLTGVGAEIGVPLAAIGNGLSTTGALVEIGVQLNNEDLNGAGTNAGFMVADKLIEKGLNKVLPGSGNIKDADFNLDKSILTQGASLKTTAVNRAVSKEEENK